MLSLHQTHYVILTLSSLLEFCQKSRMEASGKRMIDAFYPQANKAQRRWMVYRYH